MSSGKLPERPLRYQDWPTQPYWPSFVEKLLLSLIDAHPPAEPADSSSLLRQKEERLEKALEAIFLLKRAQGRDREYDLPALMQMAREKLVADSHADFEQSVLGIPDDTRRISARAAARAAEHLTRGNSPEARADRLRSRLRDTELLGYLSQVALFGYHEEEEAMERDLRRIARILQRWNVDLNVDMLALGMASLWEPKQGK